MPTSLTEQTKQELRPIQVDVPRWVWLETKAFAGKQDVLVRDVVAQALISYLGLSTPAELSAEESNATN